MGATGIMQVVHADMIIIDILKGESKIHNISDGKIGAEIIANRIHEFGNFLRTGDNPKRKGLVFYGAYEELLPV